MAVGIPHGAAYAGDNQNTLSAVGQYRVIVTFIIAQITDEDGELSLIADTKLTVEHDDRATRQIYTRPCQKVVILDDDVVAGFAGDTPETSLRHLAGLRGMPIDKIVENLVEYTARLSLNPWTEVESAVDVRKIR